MKNVANFDAVDEACAMRSSTPYDNATTEPADKSKVRDEMNSPNDVNTFNKEATTNESVEEGPGFPWFTVGVGVLLLIFLGVALWLVFRGNVFL